MVSICIKFWNTISIEFMPKWLGYFNTNFMDSDIILLSLIEKCIAEGISAFDNRVIIYIANTVHETSALYCCYAYWNGTHYKECQSMLISHAHRLFHRSVDGDGCCFYNKCQRKISLERCILYHTITSHLISKYPASSVQTSLRFY